MRADHLEVCFRVAEEAEASHSQHLLAYVSAIEERAAHVRVGQWAEAERLVPIIMDLAIKMANCNAVIADAVRELGAAQWVAA